MTKKKAAPKNQLSAKMVAMAQWATERRISRPTLRYVELLAEIRDRFDLGKTQGEQVIKHSRAMLSKTNDETDWDAELTAHYMDILEGAKFDKEWRAARAILDSLRRHKAAGAPDRLEVTIPGGMTDDELEELDDDQLALLATIDAKRRAKESEE